MVLNSFVIGHELVQKTFKQKETDQCKETEISVRNLILNILVIVPGLRLDFLWTVSLLLLLQPSSIRF